MKIIIDAFGGDNAPLEIIKGAAAAVQEYGFEILLAGREREIREILLTVYNALKEKGYNPINQLVGYILSEDPTYITTHNNARSLVRKLDRDELLRTLVKSYLGE